MLMEQTKNKRFPVRRCVACNKRTDKNDLIRIAVNKDGVICIDTSKTLQSRGCYLCDDARCIEKAIKKKPFSRIFKKDAGDKIYEELKIRYGK